MSEQTQTKETVKEIPWVSCGKLLKEGELHFTGDDEVWFVQINGKLSGISSVCTHKMGPVHQGPLLENCKILCPWHGYEFELKTGQCTSHESPPLRCYDVKVENRTTWIRKRG